MGEEATADKALKSTKPEPKLVLKSDVSSNMSATAPKSSLDTSSRKREAEESERNRQKIINTNGTDELTEKTDVIKGAKDESK